MNVDTSDTAACKWISMHLMGDTYKKGLIVAAEKVEHIRWYKRVAAAVWRESAHALKRLGA